MALAVDRAELLIEAVSKVCGTWRNAFAALGLAVLAGYTIRTLYRFTTSCYQHFAGAVGLQKRLRSYGDWAVVTGCTRGIGREFAYQLASLGFNMILMARNQEALQELAADLDRLYGVSIVRIRVDFNSGRQIYSDIEDLLSTKDIGILVNNVGVMYDYPQYFHLIEEEKLEELINVNVASAQMLTHFILRESFLPKKRGLVIFLSSGACFNPTPQMSAYAATKKYLSYLSESLAAEMNDLGLPQVRIQALTPMYVATKMTAYSPWIGTPFFLLSPDPKTYVTHAMWTLGMTTATTGYWPHSIQLWCASLVPTCCWIYFANRFLSHFRGTAEKES